MNSKLIVAMQITNGKLGVDNIFSNFIKENNGKFITGNYISDGNYINTFIIEELDYRIMISRLENGDYTKGYGLESYHCSYESYKEDYKKIAIRLLNSFLPDWEKRKDK